MADSLSQRVQRFAFPFPSRCACAQRQVPQLIQCAHFAGNFEFPQLEYLGTHSLRGINSIELVVFAIRILLSNVRRMCAALGFVSPAPVAWVTGCVPFEANSRGVDDDVSACMWVGFSGSFPIELDGARPRTPRYTNRTTCGTCLLSFAKGTGIPGIGPIFLSSEICDDLSRESCLFSIPFTSRCACAWRQVPDLCTCFGELSGRG